MRIAVRDLKPNPFRNVARCPIDEEKVSALVRSIKDTSFWDNLVARKATSGTGYEIAYGHHRLRALQKTNTEFIDIPVRNLDDTAMARIMAHENMEEWAHSAMVEQETVRAIVQGFADGRIRLPPIKRGVGNGGALRIAPSFRPDDHHASARAEASKAYTAASLGEFLNWKDWKVEAILKTLMLIEEGLATDEQFEGLTTRQAEEVALQTRRVLGETDDAELAREIGGKLSAGFDTRKEKDNKKKRRRADGQEQEQKDVTIHNAREKADQMMGNAHRKKKPGRVYKIQTLAVELTHVYGNMLTEKVKAKTAAVIDNPDELPSADRRSLVSALRALIKQAERYVEKIEG